MASILTINITKTARGYIYSNAQSGRTVGKITKSPNKTSNGYYYETYGTSGYGSLELTGTILKSILIHRAAQLGANINFINL